MTRKQILEYENNYLMPGIQRIATWSNIVVSSAQGAIINDTNGKKYIDFFTGVGVAGIGHSHPVFIEEIKEQLSKSVVGSFPTEIRAKYLNILAKYLPDRLKQIQFYSGGSEAVEAAIRLARNHTNKTEIIGFKGGFHGKTLGSMSAAGITNKFGIRSKAPGFHQVPYAYCYRCPFNKTYPICKLECANYVREYINDNCHNSLAAIIVEPAQGTNGNIIPPDEFIIELAKIAKEFNALLIFDEIITGFGKTGKMFSFENFPGIKPDILLLGKSIASGFPLSAIAANKYILIDNLFSKPSSSSSSYGGNPLACAAALGTLKVFEQENLLEHVNVLAEVFKAETKNWKKEISMLGNIQQKGILIGFELVQDEKKTPLDSKITKSIFDTLVENGLIAMSYDYKIRLYPPLNISIDLFKKGLAIIKNVFLLFDKKYYNHI